MQTDLLMQISCNELKHFDEIRLESQRRKKDLQVSRLFYITDKLSTHKSEEYPSESFDWTS